jgi:hypothetical protein
MAAVYVKSTEDGRKVEVIDGWLCLAGVKEADTLVPLIEHPNRQAISRAVPGATHMGGRIPLRHDETAVAWTSRVGISLPIRWPSPNVSARWSGPRLRPKAWSES